MALPMLSCAMRIISFHEDDVRRYKLLRRYLATHGYFWKDGTIRCIHESEVPLDPVTFEDTAINRIPGHNCTKKNANHMISDVPLYTGDEFKNYESHRLLSFMNACNPWPRSLDKFALAAAGFYYTGVDDKCSCAFCNLSVSDWELCDKADEEHRRWNPQCPFINGKPVGNVPLHKETTMLEGVYNMPKTTAVRAEAPTHENMSKFYTRNETFATWKHGGDVTALAKAGFFNLNDQLTCFYCNGTINDPKNIEDPWISHAAWFPTCEYLLKEKKYTFVKSIQTLVLKW